MVELVPVKMEEGVAERVTVGVPGAAGILALALSNPVMDPLPHAASTRINETIIENTLVTFKFSNFMIIPYFEFYISNAQSL